MRIVDHQKLGQDRDMIDRDIMQIALETGCSRPQAYMRLMVELDQRLLIFSGEYGWWSGCAVPLRGFGDFTIEVWRKLRGSCKESAELQRLCQFILDKTIYGAHAESVATAMILLTLDSDADVFIEVDQLPFLYPEDEWMRVMDATPFANLNVDAPNQRHLFEEDEEYEQRCFMFALRENMRRISFDALVPAHGFHRAS